MTAERRTGEGRSRQGRRGFTLVELLVVITIIGLLIVLLVPGVTAAWHVAQMTHCKTNLCRIFEAHGVWQSEHPGQVLQASWMGQLLPYVEYNTKVFVCQASPFANSGSGSSSGSGSGSGSGGGTGGGTGDDGTGSGDDDGSGNGGTDDDWKPSTAEVDESFEFAVYLQQGSTGPGIGQGSGSGIKGDFLWSIPLGDHPWVRRTEGSNSAHYNVDDCGYGNTSKDDLELEITYNDDHQPIKITVVRASGYNSDSVKNRFYYDLKGCGEVLIENWVKHYGESVSLEVTQAWDGAAGGYGSSGGGSGYGGGGALGGGSIYGGSSSSGGSSTIKYPLVLGDYAISRGTYDTGKRVIHAVDAKLFFVLDYGCRKSVADYNQYDLDDDWYKYFITDVDRWKEDYGQEGKDWRVYQALRHFSRANVLFCDGHIETLGAEDLGPKNSLWVYEGR